MTPRRSGAESACRTFMVRTLTQQFAQAAHIEIMRLKHLGFSSYSWRNRLILAHLAPLGILVLALIIGCWRGVLVIVLAGVIGRSFHELINYVQYFGLVRVQNLLPNPLQCAPL